ncbi:hypothetical protein [Tautonia plasticadhaerens]|uniref:Uncharacterized protein n=1 Tax=Tautonia plasticadhaerens TaxID=2527974 RepID=A0A518H0T9_9BACT|nr:hypothetical protein [Tautonia plasticadhaerens]QDV34465.1 hypothetical protein ElP_23540 [Tautonia plasticadhaerens]
MASLKQTIANRINSLKSTGPRSAGGKERASRNATAHGLSRLPSTPPALMAKAIADRMAAWKGAYRPVGEAQEWHFEQFCAESVRLDACRFRILAARAEAAERVSESWDDDRSAEVAALAARLADAPEVIQPKLLQSRHGVLWLIERWGDVAAEVARLDGWTPENWFLALDLLGVPVEGRRHSGPWDLDPEDGTAGPGLELARSGVEALKARLEDYLDARDARHREAAEAGLDPDRCREVRLLERYAADARRQVARNRDELRRLQAEAARAPSAPAPSASGSPRPTPDGPPGPRPDRTARWPRPTPATVIPEPRSAPSSASPDPNPGPSPSPAPIVAEPGRVGAASPSRPSTAPAPLGDRFRERTAPGNRRARRALAAAARRS